MKMLANVLLVLLLTGCATEAELRMDRQARYVEWVNQACQPSRSF